MSTIAAISTAPAVGGIGIIRISGEQALSVADSVFCAAVKGKKISDMAGYTAAYGSIVNGSEKVDECVALVFRAPHSYTGEDVVELSCHGGIFVLNEVLSLVLKAGAVPAQAGEFTKRAFLNGKLDLTQAEAVSDIISGQGEAALRSAVSAKDGALQRKIREITDSLVELSSHLAAWIDYPEEDIEQLDGKNLTEALQKAGSQTQELIKTFSAGQVVTQGIETVIAGRTNVGKSSVMNFLCKEQKSIVTDIAGTTRDVVEVTAKVGNAVLRLADTAGLRSCEDKVERIGIENAKKRIDSAGFVIAVFDGTQPLEAEDRELLGKIEGRPHIVLINKNDLKCVLTQKDFPGEKVVSFSAKTAQGEDDLTVAIEQALGTESFDPYAPMLANKRQYCCCNTALKCIDEALTAIDAGFTLDAVNVSIDAAIEAFLELTGERATERVVDNVFHRFCVGK